MNREVLEDLGYFILMLSLSYRFAEHTQGHRREDKGGLDGDLDDWIEVTRLVEYLMNF